MAEFTSLESLIENLDHLRLLTTVMQYESNDISTTRSLFAVCLEKYPAMETRLGINSRLTKDPHFTGFYSSNRFGYYLCKTYQ
jgi:hypothetical protein